MEILIIVIGIVVILAAEAKIYRKNGLSQIDYKCYFSESEITEGDSVEFTEEIVNQSLLPLPCFKSEITASKWLEFAQTRSSVTDKSRFISSLFFVKGKSKIVRRWKVSCESPGVFDVSSVRLTSSDFFGMITLSGVPDCEMPVITVFPKRHIFDFNPYQNVNPDGTVLSVSRHLNDPFHINGIFEYDGRQPLNSINWQATAKSSELMANRYDCPSQTGFSVILDCQSFRSRSNAAHSVRVAAQILYLLEKNGSNAELITTALENDKPLCVTHINSRRFYHDCMKTLAKAVDCENKELSRVQRQICRDSSKIIITAAPRDVEKRLYKSPCVIIVTANADTSELSAEYIKVRENSNAKITS